MTRCLVFFIPILLTACLYIPSHQQGNLLEVEDVEKIQLGSTQAEVRSYLGIPLLKHPFKENHWVYAYQILIEEDNYFKQHLVLVFDTAGKVIKIDKENIVESPPLPK